MLHFDYPYFKEQDDGLTDEILGNVWTRNGQVKLVGSEAPADQIISGTPKFGYRCLSCSGSGDYVSASVDNVFSFDAAKSYEFSFFLRPSANQAGNFINLLNSSTSILTAGLDGQMHIVLYCQQMGLTFATAKTLSASTWHSIALRFSPSAASVIIDGNEETCEISSRSAFSVNECRLGGFAGQMDEFVFRDSFSSSLPSEPVKAQININDLGGFGTGSLGNVAITAPGTVINSCALFKITSSFILGLAPKPAFLNARVGKFGDFVAGAEVLIINTDGDYCFRTITSVSGASLTFNKPHTVTGTCQIITVPHFNTLTINAGASITPYPWDSLCGGIVVFRVKGNCTVNGSIITSGLGRERTDKYQLTHAKLIDRFIMNTGGAIFITCGGTFSAGSSARIGGTWDGALKGGQGAAGKLGSPGGAGYGASGSGDVHGGRGGNGGVGGGGGGGEDGCIGGDAGTENATGGYAKGYSYSHGNNSKTYTKAGGTQGIDPNSSGNDYTDSVPGAGAGGTARAYSDVTAGHSGANLVLITNKLHVDGSAVSTGGAVSSKLATCSGGGGGTGFCYIACDSMS